MKNRGVLFRRLRPLLGHRSHWLPIPGTILRKCRGGRRRGSDRGSAGEGARLPAPIASAASCRSTSRAFTAVAYDWRRTDFIYLSPLGGDDEFSAAVTQDGVHVETADGGHHLNWDDVTELAERLAVE